MRDEFAFVGDVHGDSRRLDEMLSLLFDATENLVFLGDYVNRGPDSSGVLERLSCLRRDRPGSTFCLAGNHDQLLLEVLEGRASMDRLLLNGGGTTIASYVANPFGDVHRQLVDAVPAHHVEFLRDLPEMLEGPGWHARHIPLTRPRESLGFGIYGHVAQSGTPRVTTTHALVDTGCGSRARGALSAFLWPSKSVLQVR